MKNFSVQNVALGDSSMAADGDDSRARLRRELDLWRSPKMREVRDIIERASQADVTVLIGGETGTGKDVVARAIHLLSTRQAGPFAKVNCAAVPRELLESELFGHERGAFSGAHELRLGAFQSANHGTILLDAIEDLHPALQGKLLHVLQDGQFSRLGGRSTIKVDVRILAATNQNLQRAVAGGRFREDLYYRLNVVQIAVPPLRERIEEIPPFVGYFVERYAGIFRREAFMPQGEAMQRLLRYRYPGNVRELENIVKRMIVLGDRDLRRSPFLITAPDDVDPHKVAESGGTSLKDISKKAAQAAEREAIREALEQTHWNRIKAARRLGISYRALLYKIKGAGLDPNHGSSGLA